MRYPSKKIDLFYTEGSSDKQYQVTCTFDPSKKDNNYHVSTRYGRRGRLGKENVSAKDSGLSGSYAYAVFDKIVESKRKKGYTSHLHGNPGSGVMLSHEVILGTTEPKQAGLTELQATLKLELLPQLFQVQATVPEFFENLEASDLSIQPIPKGPLTALWVKDSSVYKLDLISDSMALEEGELAELVASKFNDFVLLAVVDAFMPSIAIIDADNVSGLPLKSLKERHAVIAPRLDALEPRVSLLPFFDGDEALEAASGIVSLMTNNNPLAVSAAFRPPVETFKSALMTYHLQGV